MLIRILFALLALGALVILVSGPPGDAPEPEAWHRKLLVIALLITCLGMVVSWGRWFRLDSPRGNLAFVSKLFGWAGASGVPLAVSSGNWVGVVVCVLLPLLAFGLWGKRSWAAWPWYAVALACLAPALLGLNVLAYFVLFQTSIAGLNDGVSIAMMIVWVLFWGSTAVVLMRELTVWRRGLSSPREVHAPSSGS